MLKELHLKYVGPAPQFDIELADRLNIFTGDNGLGKTFLLEIAWRGLTETWVQKPPLPRREKGVEPEIKYLIQGNVIDSDTAQPITSKFKWQRQEWSKIRGKRSLPGLVIYIGAEGEYSVWDPARNYWEQLDGEEIDASINDRLDAYHFTADQLWNGLKKGDTVLCNGLLQDWVSWQNQPEQNETSPFRVLCQVIEKLAPHRDKSMKPGKPTRVSTQDVRDIPTLELSYGTVPVIDASAGTKRILAIAYLLVWTWYEHQQASDFKNQDPCDRLVLLIDEVEAHLHPQWQRSILPALLAVPKALQATMKTQIIATTHSPLVLASAEPDFDENQDQLFLFELKNSNVTLEKLPWAKHGDAVGWLTSPIFGLEQARSREAEIAIKAANALMRGESLDTFPENLQTKEQIHQELLRVLTDIDEFWDRWTVKIKK
ncbi:AAA family ATPase [Planktothricoides raciborskii]|uniref:AAA family ATPase n=1 Tax=Planktothricoides raciborskii FACHB-1370 TaxID=2949576 RepID=A0ABR8EIN6_9CYAN|nr:ATP-binding protein [Planktothricoides raciborskii]MBD2546729.1 AAA family ATPase [Planktothricoides raciborskii FACHB-1370]MBD2585461.1 AAA family ATPase [Planktothricoides raciborskii FACHB-1261]